MYVAYINLVMIFQISGMLRSPLFWFLSITIISLAWYQLNKMVTQLSEWWSENNMDRFLSDVGFSFTTH